MSTDVPASLKPLAPLVKIGNEYANRDVIIYYWCLYRAVQEGMKLDKSSPDALNFLTNMLSILEKVKKDNPSVEALTQDIVAQAHIEDQAQRLFNYAESQDKAAIFNLKVVKAFYTSGYLFEVLGVFGEPDENIQSAKKYAKWRATYIHNCLKTGETPTPGNQIVAESNNELGESDVNASLKDMTTGFKNINVSAEGQQQFLQNQHGHIPDLPPVPYSYGGGSANTTGYNFNSAPSSSIDGNYSISGAGGNTHEGFGSTGSHGAGYGQSPSLFGSSGGAQPTPPPRGIAPFSNNSGYSPSPPNNSGSYSFAPQASQQQQPFLTSSNNDPTKNLTMEDFTQARKFAKYALSALDYDDAKTAILNMHKALAILEK